MATITITIPDASETRVIAAFAKAEGYQPNLTTENPANGAISTVPNPETRKQFVKRKLAEHLKDRAVSGEADAAAETARKAAEDDAKLIVIA